MKKTLFLVILTFLSSIYVFFWVIRSSDNAKDNESFVNETPEIESTQTEDLSRYFYEVGSKDRNFQDNAIEKCATSDKLTQEGVDNSRTTCLD